jgi:hypothetical protein
VTMHVYVAHKLLDPDITQTPGSRPEASRGTGGSGTGNVTLAFTLPFATPQRSNKACNKVDHNGVS